MVSTVGGVVAISSGAGAALGVSLISGGVSSIGFGTAMIIDGFEGGERNLPGGLAEAFDMGIGGKGSYGQMVDIFSGGLPKNVLDAGFMGIGLYNSNFGKSLFNSPSFNGGGFNNNTFAPRDNTGVYIWHP